MRRTEQRASRAGRLAAGAAAVVLTLVVSACGSHASHSAHGSGTAPTGTAAAASNAANASNQTPATSSAAVTYCLRFTSAVISVAPNFSFAPALSVYAPGNDPGVGGSIGANLKRLTTGSYTCQWRTASADIEVGVFLLRTAGSQSDWESANGVKASTVTSLSGIGDWAYTQSGTSAIVAGVGTNVLFVDTDGAPQVNGENLATGLIPALG